MSLRRFCVWRSDGESSRAALLLAAVFCLALLIRSLGFEHVLFDEMVLFAPGDAMYHLRRSFYTFVNFPAVLVWDPYINFPDGAPVPWAPLFDFGLGAIARLIANDQSGFERVAAWVPPVLGALTVIPVYGAARRVAPQTVALGAAVVFALIPISVNYSRVGNPDHHVAVALIGAYLLWLCMIVVDPRTDDRVLRRSIPLLVLARVALMATWHGNLLYLVVFESAILFAIAFTERIALARAELWSTLATALLLVPVLAVLPTPTQGAYSSISLSRLHWIALVTPAIASGVVIFRASRSPASSTPVRLAWMVGSVLGFWLIVFAFPEPREGLIPALQFGSMSDGVGTITPEQYPLFPIFGNEVQRSPTLPWANFYWLIPVAPIALLFLFRKRAERPAAWVLAWWCTAFGGLAIAQRRYGNDLSPAAAIAFALLFAGVARGVAARIGAGRIVEGGLAFAMVVGFALPAIRDVYLPRAIGSLQIPFATRPVQMNPRSTVAGSLISFAHEVREQTPETRGFVDQHAVPAYGVIAEPNLGHVLHYVARRATATDPMWAFIGPVNWDRTEGFLATADESEALEYAEQLRGRFVVTTASRNMGSVVDRLHRADGRGSVRDPRLEHFRLIAEASPGTPGLRNLFERRPSGAVKTIPYKLFEIVPGAVVEVRGREGEEVALSAIVTTNRNRHFEYASRARIGVDGVARIRVPYPTRSKSATGIRGAYQMRVGGREERVEVDEEAVTRGRRVPVPGPAKSDQSKKRMRIEPS